MKWTEKIQKAEKHFQQWRTNGKKITDRFRGRKTMGYTQEIDYNIHHANGQLYIAMVYPRTPLPVTRRKGERGLDVAEAIEKTLKFVVDQYDFDEVIEPTMLDYYNAGMGQIIVNYVPFLKKMPSKVRLVERDGVFRDEKGNQYEDVEFDARGAFSPSKEERLIYEEIQFETVPWDRFGWDPDALIWDDVEYAYIKYDFTEHRFEQKFGAAKCSKVSWGARREQAESYTREHVTVYRVFDKVKRKEIWVCDSYEGDDVEKSDDPWGLVEFYPFPRPLLGTVTSNNFTPVPQFQIMEPLFQELDEIQARIFNIISAIKVRGAYNKAYEEVLGNLTKSDDDEYVPLDGWAQFKGEGGLKANLDHWPLGDYIAALTTLTNARNVIRQQIDEMTPFFDAARGGGRTEESAQMTKTKTRYSDARLNREIKLANKFIRNLYRIAGEMIAELFEAKTISEIIGAPFSEMQLSQLRDDINRKILIDIEIDVDAYQQDVDEQRQLTEFLNALTGAMQVAAQANEMGLTYGNAILEEVVRRYPAFRTIDRPNQLAPPAQSGPVQPGAGGGNGGQPQAG